MIEGRDIGTVVAPDAEVKVYLVADPTMRARRAAGRAAGHRRRRARHRPARCATSSDAERMQPAQDARARSTRPTSRSTTSSRGSRSSCASALPALMRAADRRLAPSGALHASGRPSKRDRARCAVYGKENDPVSGGVVLALNHFSWIDLPLVRRAPRPRTIYYMAKVEAHRSRRGSAS